MHLLSSQRQPSTTQFKKFQLRIALVWTAIIRNLLLKEYADLLTRPLTSLFNRSIIGGVFPFVFKLAVPVPVYKTEGKTEMNYRPISLLPIISKIFEILLKTRILSFLLENNYFRGKQHAFFPEKCADDATVNQIAKITNNLENGKKVATVYLDITKAFGAVNSEILLKN